MDDDFVLFDWIRHYAALVVLAVTLGTAGSFLYLRLFPPRSEAWSLVVETGTAIPPRQLGPVADAVFHSASVYGPVMQQLKITGSPQRFLADSTDIRPIPGTNTLIVVGRSSSLSRAEQISSVMAASLVQAFHSRAGFENFTVFSEAAPAPVREAVSQRQALLLGGGLGFWIGLGLAGLHFRIRRPLLNPRAALRIAWPAGVTMLDGNGPSWLGVLTSTPVWKDTLHNRAALWDTVDAAGRPMVVAPGAGSRARHAVERRMSQTFEQLGGEVGQWPAVTEEADLSLVVCHPSTPALDFGLVAADQTDALPRRRVQVVWVG